MNSIVLAAEWYTKAYNNGLKLAGQNLAVMQRRRSGERNSGGSGNDGGGGFFDSTATGGTSSGSGGCSGGQVAIAGSCSDGWSEKKYNQSGEEIGQFESDVGLHTEDREPEYETPAYEAPAYEPPAYEPPAYTPSNKGVTGRTGIRRRSGP